jgi:hypothetical protein
MMSSSNAPFGMYEATIPGIVQTLKGLTTILKKANAHCEAKNIAKDVILAYRLSPDMFHLTRQVQIVTDQAKGLGARLSGRELPSYPDTEASFEELQARLAKVTEFLKSISPGEIDGTEAKTINLKLGPREMTFSGAQYAFQFVLPNFYFHAATAYDILRLAGVGLTKADFLGATDA